MKLQKVKNSYLLTIEKLVIGRFTLSQLKRLRDLIEGILEEESQEIWKIDSFLPKNSEYDRKVQK